MLIARKSDYGSSDPLTGKNEAIDYKDITIGNFFRGLWQSMWDTEVSNDVALNQNYDANNFFWQTDVKVDPKVEVSYLSNF